MIQLIYIVEVDVVLRRGAILYDRQPIFFSKKGLPTTMAAMGYRYLVHGLPAAVFLR
jgi:hypothetical protein